MKIVDISNAKVGAKVKFSARVSSIKKNVGLTIIELDDGTAKISGILNVPLSNISLGNKVTVNATVKKLQNKPELDINSIESIDVPEQQFSVKSARLNLLFQDFTKTANLISDAIAENRSIIIRHHDDPDGYISGYILEKTLWEVLSKKSSGSYIFRSSSKTPYYDYTDALRDLNNFLNNARRFNNKAPLLILCDLGSNSQSLMSIKRLKAYDFKIIIIDHHRYDVENQQHVSVFLNPHTQNLGSDLCAGILCFELSRLFLKSDEIKHLPAIAAIADKSTCAETDDYIKMSGWDKETLMNWSLYIDYETYYLRFQESYELLVDILMPTPINQTLRKTLLPFIESKLKDVKALVKHQAKVEKINNFKVVRIKKPTHSFDYVFSKLARTTHELYSGPRITIVETEDSLIFRCEELKFSIVDLLKALKQHMPEISAEGGGHDHAGTIKFDNNYKRQVNEFIMSYLKQINKGGNF